MDRRLDVCKLWCRFQYLYLTCPRDGSVEDFGVCAPYIPPVFDPDFLLSGCSGHYHEVNQVRCNSTRTRLASCSDDTTARIWNVSNLSSRSPESIPGLVSSDNNVVLRGHTQSVSSIGWCPDHPHGTNEIVATYVNSCMNFCN
jgi:WD40 repeat protein